MRLLTPFFARATGIKEAFWSKIGAAWLHEDGKGYNLSSRLFLSTAALR